MTRKELRQEARNCLSGNWVRAAGITLLAILLGGVSSSGGSIEYNVEQQISEEVFMQLLPYVLLGLASTIAVGIFFSNVVGIGYSRFSLNLADQDKFAAADLFTSFKNGQYLSAVKLQFLKGLLIFGWSLLFVIPGIVATYSYAMAPYIHLDHPELTARQCLSASKRLMNGRKADLFLLDLSFFGWALLCIFTFGIGGLFLTPYEYTAQALFYRDITENINIEDYI